jgi:hypothetical protein
MLPVKSLTADIKTKAFIYLTKPVDPPDLKQAGEKAPGA